MHKIFLKFVISILFPGLSFELPNLEIGQESGVNLYKKLTNPHEHHGMRRRIRQKFLLLAHCRFILSKILGNYQVGTRALTHHTPTMQTIFVLQHISNCFLRPVEANYPWAIGGCPPIALNKCCVLLAMGDILLKRNPQLGNIESVEILRLVQSCAFANIGMRIESDADFGLDSSYIGSEIWRELTPQTFWVWANQDGLLRRMILIFISNKNHHQSSKVDTIYDGIIRRASPQP